MADRRPLAERFWSKVNKNGPMPSAEAVAVHPEIAGQRCWIYGQNIAKRGGVWVVGRCKQTMAYHVAWFLETGTWPKPRCLHKCDQPGCVRFSHLFEGTDRDNVADMIAKGRDRVIGARHSQARLTAEQVAEIRRLGQPWVRSGQRHRRHGTAALVRDIAKRFGVRAMTIKK